ncbi:glutathione-dependent formaldehyde-activating enzyme [Xylaria sp. FL1042]|nr:glutathione-dependent formaldehyde-activating enzyme [Xylaria sp. FL1042]
MAEQQASLKTYRGNCHCASFVYEITLPEIKQASECNCSICYKKAAIWVLPEPTNAKFVKGDPTALTNYNFNKNQFTHKFCSTCGVSVMVVGHLKPPKAGEDKLPENGFNVRTLQHGQVNIWKLDTKAFDGASIPPAYETPKYTGPEPAGDAEGLQLYTGSCHCGAVTVSLKSQPLNKDTQGLLECDCSICGRYGATWTYLPRAQVAIEGSENFGVYLFNKRIASKNFCKICGVPVSSDVVQLGDEQVAQLDEQTRGWYSGMKDQVAFNLRVVNGLNIKDLNPGRWEGYANVKPAYVEP